MKDYIMIIKQENKLIDILNYCESIIADTEDIEENIAEDYLDNQEFFIIRQNAENIQSIITKYDIDNNEELLFDDIEEINEYRIEIYQYAKYILEDYEENNRNHDLEIINAFNDISEASSVISDLIKQ